MRGVPAELVRGAGCPRRSWYGRMSALDPQKGVSRIMPLPPSLRGVFWRVARAFVALAATFDALAAGRLSLCCEGLRGAATCARALEVVPPDRASLLPVRASLLSGRTSLLPERAARAARLLFVGLLSMSELAGFAATSAFSLGSRAALAAVRTSRGRSSFAGVAAAAVLESCASSRAGDAAVAANSRTPAGSAPSPPIARGATATAGSSWAVAR